MKGKFSARVTPLMISAMRMAWSSLSMTHGPATRKRFPAPMRVVELEGDGHERQELKPQGAQGYTGYFFPLCDPVSPVAIDFDFSSGDSPFQAYETFPLRPLLSRSAVAGLARR